MRSNQHQGKTIVQKTSRRNCASVRSVKREAAQDRMAAFEFAWIRAVADKYSAAEIATMEHLPTVIRGLAVAMRQQREAVATRD